MIWEMGFQRNWVHFIIFPEIKKVWKSLIKDIKKTHEIVADKYSCYKNKQTKEQTAVPPTAVKLLHSQTKAKLWIRIESYF